MMTMMNGFAMGFFFPKQVQPPPPRAADELRRRDKIAAVEPRADRESEEPAILALHAHRFF